MLEFCDERELRVANTWIYKTDKKKITYSAGGCKTEIGFVLVRIWKLNENRTKVKFDKRVKELVRTEAPDL